jgi:rod shape-determining protein MreD
MKKFLFYLLTMWAVLWTQVVLNHFLGGTQFSVNLVLVAVLYFGLTLGSFVAQAFGFVGGLLVDASSLGLLGMQALLYAVGGYSAGLVRRQLDATKVWTQVLFSFIVSVVYAVVYLGFDRLFSGGDRPVPWVLLMQPLVTAAAAPLVFWVLTRWCAAWDIGPRAR